MAHGRLQRATGAREAGRKSDLKDAIEQVNEYADNATGYHKGLPLEFSGVYNVHLFGDVYMSIDTADLYSGFKVGGKTIVLPSIKDLAGLLFYSLARPNGEGEPMPVSIPVVVKDMNKVRNEAVEAFVLVAGATIFEDVLTSGAGILDDIPSFIAGAEAAVAISHDLI